ncbi:MAG: N-acetylmuramoyl-L-alanine amidase [Elusimicrobia bacterium]|nr:N-acetylmuramoyl-L-alanine amidase [Elusimicrobiota bacterium]
MFKKVLILLLFLGSHPLFAEPFPPPLTPITIAYPDPGATLSVSTATFILGSIIPSTGTFRINGQIVKPHRNGGFLAYLPIPSLPAGKQPAEFVFHCELQYQNTTYTLDHKIRIFSLQTPPTTQIFIDPNFLLPNEAMELNPGDWLDVRLRGTPGAEGEWSLSGVKKHLPLFEMENSGIYRGSYQIQPGDKAKEAEVEFSLKHKDLGKTRETSKGKVTIPSEPFRVVEVSSELAQGETGPGNSYFMFVKKGTRLLMNGRQGKKLRAFLSETESAWFDSGAFQILPEGYIHPRTTLEHINTSVSDNSTIVSLSLGSPVPYSIEPTPEGLELKLYYTQARTTFMTYDSKDTFVQNIQWKQIGRQTCVVSIRLSSKETLWGYHVSLKPGSLNLELKRAPRLKPRPSSVFAGLKIILDPGHSPRTSPPWDGAVGPHGTQEPIATLALAKNLKALLEKAGAQVVMTRSGEEEVAIYERPKIAWENRGDLFISLHYNAIPDGTNPFEKTRGFSVFYYHAHSLALAQSIHRAYLRRHSLPDEGLRYGNLVVSRISQMPAVLVESAYLIFPEQEELITSRRFQTKIAIALLEGAKNFLEKERNKQQKK